MFENPVIKEAIYLASPALYDSLSNVNNLGLEDKKTAKLKVSFLKYALRICTRSTPFGLFAGITSMKWGENDNIKLSLINESTRHTRLDMLYLVGLIQYLEKLPEIRESLIYFPNTSIHKESNRIKYIETIFTEENKYIHRVSSVARSNEMESILDKANSGATIQELIVAIQSELIQEEEARGFINQIIESQVLVSELYPTVTGQDLLKRTVASLEKIKFNNKIAEQWAQKLQDIGYYLKTFDLKFGNNVESYRDFQSIIDKLGINYDNKRLLQVDLFKNTSSSVLNNKLQSKLLSALRVLNRLTPPAKSTFNDFRDAFRERYEDREVSLLEALDVESGIGYLQDQFRIDSDLIEGLNGYGTNSQRTIQWNKYESFFHRKAIKALKDKAQVIEVFDSELTDFEEKESDLPNSICVLFKIVSEHSDTKLEVKNTFGASAIDVIGRFAYGDSAVNQTARDIANHEASSDEDVIYAEIAHLPESRTGNILFRPIFRLYEIPYLVASSRPTDFQIKVEDLYISLRGNKIIIRSRNLNKIIIPRLSNAHNYSFNALPVYQFLCELQKQDERTSLVWSWGSLQGEFTFLPRVVYKEIILCTAQWIFNTNEISKVLFSTDSSMAIKSWRKENFLPNLLLLSEGDNELLINLENDLSLEMLQDILKSREVIVFKEFIQEVSHGIVKDNLGEVYANEFIAFLLKDKITINKDPLRNKAKDYHSQYYNHTFAPGVKWLYYKIYSGYLNSEKLITLLLYPLYKTLLEKFLIKKMFFIRYKDPKSHLRVRFEMHEEGSVAAVMKEVNTQLSRPEVSELIYNIQLDSYKREIDRYGIENIETSESLFHNDSVCMMKAAFFFKGANNNLRWVFAIKSIDALLNDFHLELGDKIRILKRMKESYGSEFEVQNNKIMRKNLSNKYRRFAFTVSSILQDKNEIESLVPIWDIINERSKNNSDVLIDLKRSKLPDSSITFLDELLFSYIHMICNRIFIYKYRLHEMVVYDFMYLDYQKQMSITSRNH